MNKNSFFKYILLVLAVTSLVSCDNDSNEIGANMVGENHFGVEPVVYGISAYNQGLGVVETTTLPVQQFGIYDNPVFGKTVASVATQVLMETQNPTITGGVEMISAVLTVPYFSTGLSTDASTGDSKYVLDSIYGKLDNNGKPISKIKLSVYESNYFMSNLVNGEQEKFYSDQFSLFNSYIIGTPLNTGIVSENEAFVFNDAEDKETTTDEEGVTTTTRFAPRMKLNLDKQFFQTKIFDAGVAGGYLVNNNAFKSYFKGLFFKVEQSGSEAGNMAMMNFGAGKITLRYKQYTSAADHTLVEKSMVLNFSGKSVNLLQQTDNPDYANALANRSIANGDAKLYLKGGQGSLSVINLFTGNGLATAKSHKDEWLINEASLSFYIQRQADGDGNGMDASGVTGVADEPNRIYLFDLDNNRPIIDYYNDQSTSNSPKYAKYIHGGIIEKDVTKRGTRYKIRLTNHIRNIINKDSTNVRLGLVVTESIGTISNKSLLNPFVLPGVAGTEHTANKNVKLAPTMSIANPFGTILWGTNIPEGNPGYDKRLKFEIFYTKPN